ncbi:hypothetical protein, partial [Phaeobacter sp. 11ANDIMAR09]|uniref:hypothetical protein n=1 Tax=Phaeobacter sp. 11ANDIMAR09 TaxID=1225647 RepID=UPI0006D6BB96
MNDELPSPPSLEEVPIELFRKRGNKTTKLVGVNDGQNTIKTRREWSHLELSEPVYVSSIELHTRGFSSFHKVAFIVE